VIPVRATRNAMALLGMITLATELIDLWRDHCRLQIEILKI
jgi:hypothetical protein